MLFDDFKKPESRLLIYHELIMYLLKGGCSHKNIRSIITILHDFYNDDYTDEQIENEVLAGHEILLETGGYKNTRNIQQEVENLIEFRGNGIISLSDFYLDLKLDRKEEKISCRMAINRLVSRKVLEKVDSGRTGIYRKINGDLQETQFITGNRGHFPIKLPLDLNSLCYLHPKSIVIVAGSKSSGKTALLLKLASDNQNSIPVDYFNSDMGDEEYTDRMVKMGFTCPEDIKFKTYNRSRDFQDLITPEKKIFIIDFLEIHENFFEIGKPIKAIWDKLKDGIAVIAIQMRTGAMMARGGDFTKEKSRLYLSMDYNNARACTRVTIVDAKAPKFKDGVKDWYRDVKIINGSRFFPMDNWRRNDDSDPKASL